MNDDAQRILGQAGERTKAQILAAKALIDQDETGVFGQLNIDTVALILAINASQISAESADVMLEIPNIGRAR